MDNKRLIPDVMPDNSEIVHYDSAGIPLYIRRGLLSAYPGYAALCHWHEDFEFIRILSGEMDYFIDGSYMHLCEGNCLFVNSGRMHYGYSASKSECSFLCVLVSPHLLTGSRMLYEKRIQPVIDDETLSYVRVQKDDDLYSDFQSLLDELILIKESGKAYELLALSILASLVSGVAHFMDNADKNEWTKAPHMREHRSMVAFITENYADDITLDNIANSAAVSRSTCCRIFREYDRMSPVRFLNIYRLRSSADMLLRTNESIAEIAVKCGFNSISYYSRQFFKYYGSQPHVYRKRNAITS